MNKNKREKTFYLDLSYGRSLSNISSAAKSRLIYENEWDKMEVISHLQDSRSFQAFCPSPVQSIELLKEQRREVEEMKQILKLSNDELRAFENNLATKGKECGHLLWLLCKEDNEILENCRRPCRRDTNLPKDDDQGVYKDESAKKNNENVKLFKSKKLLNGILIDVDRHRQRTLDITLSNISSSHNLKEALNSKFNRSIANVQTIEENIKEDVSKIQDICFDVVKYSLHRSSRNRFPEANKRFKSWAVHRMISIVGYVAILNPMKLCFKVWRSKALSIILMQKWAKYLYYQGIMKLAYAKNIINRRKILCTQDAWVLHVKEGRKKDIEKLRVKSAHLLQSFALIIASKKEICDLRINRKNRVAVYIQSYFRTHVAVKLRAKLEYQRKLSRVVVSFQCAYRCYLSKRTVENLKRLNRKKKAVINIQRVVRGVEGRALSAVRREKIIIFVSACSLQRAWRGFIARKLLECLQEEDLKHRASEIIQRYTRVFLSKNLFRLMKEESKRNKIRRNKSILVLQRVYRAHRRFVVSKIELAAQVAVARRRFRAAVRIQSKVRQISSKVIVEKLAKKLQRSMILNARRWKEAWNDQQGCWFYYDVETEATLWEPPRTGYAKSDSQLVLENGKVIDDPLIGSPDIVHNICSECDRAVATRHCEQCEDCYCTTCFKTSHPQGGRRALHTYVAIGPTIECEECEHKAASRWCIQCDDPFCSNCWEKIHARGKRVYHTFCNIRGDGSVSPRAWNSNGTHAGIFNPIHESIENYEFTGNEGTCFDTSDIYPDNSKCHYENIKNECFTENTVWTSHYDEMGNIYYYNNFTGESSYDEPVLE